MSDRTAHAEEAYANDNIRDVIIAMHLEFTIIKIAHANSNVRTRALREASLDLNNTNQQRVDNGLTALKQDTQNYQVCNWATIHKNVSYTYIQFYSNYEMQQLITNAFKGDISLTFGLLLNLYLP